jgi:oligopeptide transport system substrate-binding protein
MKVHLLPKFAVVVLSVCVLTLTACSSVTPNIETVPRTQIDSKTLNLNHDTPDSLDSIHYQYTTSLVAFNWSSEGLFRSVTDDSGLTKILPAGAEQWEITKSETVYTFHLRKNYWSDGKPVTAENYVDAIVRLLNPKEKSPFAFRAFDIVGAKEYNFGKGDVKHLGVQALNPLTLQIRLVIPTPLFLKLLSNANFLPIRKDLPPVTIDNYKTSVFSGPFKVTNIEPSEKMQFTKNPYFWDAENVHFETVNLSAIGSADEVISQFETGEVDFAISNGGLTYNTMQTLTDSHLAQGVKLPYPSVEFLEFNMKSPHGSNLNFRKAIAATLDREKYSEYFNTSELAPITKPATTLIPDSISIDSLRYRYQIIKPIYPKLSDLELQKLIDESGVKPGDTIKIWDGFKYVNRADPTSDDAISLLNQSFRKMGLKVEIASDEDFNNGDWDIAANDWIADYDDPTSILEKGLTSNMATDSSYDSPEFDELWSRLRAESSILDRVKLADKMERQLLWGDCAFIPTFSVSKFVYSQPELKGVKYSAFLDLPDITRAYRDIDTNSPVGDDGAAGDTNE